MTTENESKSSKERRKKGKELRQEIPFDSHGEWTPAVDRPDPISLLQAQDGGRIKDLLPIRYGRMLGSPFVFLRGSAVVMASDLTGTPTINIQAIQDARQIFAPGFQELMQA